MKETKRQIKNPGVTTRSLVQPRRMSCEDTRIGFGPRCELPLTDNTTEALDGIGKRSDIGLPRLSGRPWLCLISTPRLERGETGEKLGRKPDHQPSLRSHML